MISKSMERKYEHFMGWYFMAERVLEHEISFAFRCKTPNGWSKRIEKCLAFRYSARWIRKIEKNTRAAATMREEIDWKKELLDSGKFNNKFSKNILENGTKNFRQGIYLGYMYSRWRKIRGLDKDDLVDN